MTPQQWLTLNVSSFGQHTGRLGEQCYMFTVIRGYGTGGGVLMSVSGGGRPGDAPDRPPPTHGWGVLSNNLPSDLSHSDEWDDFLSQGGAWVARD